MAEIDPLHPNRPFCPQVLSHGWAMYPVKIFPRMTESVSAVTLNLTRSVIEAESCVITESNES